MYDFEVMFIELIVNQCQCLNNSKETNNYVRIINY